MAHLPPDPTDLAPAEYSSRFLTGLCIFGFGALAIAALVALPWMLGI
jgi:hypothetical protein